MTVTAPAHPAGLHPDDDILTRRDVARLFGVTSAAVATWARRGRLPEVRNETGLPRYRRADVEKLLDSVSRRAAQMAGYPVIVPAGASHEPDGRP